MSSLDGRYIGFYTTQPVWMGSKLPRNMPIIDGKPRGDVMSETILTKTGSNYELHACRDGLVLLRIDSLHNQIIDFFKRDDEFSVNKGTELLAAYLHHCNVLRLFLESVFLKEKNFYYFRTVPLRKGEVLSIEYKNCKFMGCTLPNGKGGETYNQRFPINQNWILTDDRVLFERELVEKAFKTYLLIQPDSERVRIISAICSSLGELNYLNWSGCLIHSWFVIEYFLNWKWIEYMMDCDKDDRIDLSRDIREYLLGRDFTASVMSHILAMSGYISKTDFNRLNELRKKRNEIIHNKTLLKKLQTKLKKGSKEIKEYSIGMEDCIEAFTLIEKFVKDHFSIDIYLPRGVTWSFP